MGFFQNGNFGDDGLLWDRPLTLNAQLGPGEKFLPSLLLAVCF